jgi:hypothetical protein
MGGTSARILAFSIFHVPHILGVGSVINVIWITTHTIVASMAGFILRPFVVSHKERGAGRGYIFSSHSESSVSVVIFSARPRPASVALSYGNSAPESLYIEF